MRHSYIKRKLRDDLGTNFNKFIALLLVISLFLTSSVISFSHVYALSADDGNESGGDQTVTVSKFDMEITDGYTRTEDGGYVWEANTSAEGHMFVFNILFQTSGNGYIEPGAVKITIPKSILRDKDGNPADSFEMSVPYIDQITDEFKDLHDWAYYEDEDGNLVITNINPIPAGYAYRFDVGYITTKTTFNYEDMEFFEGVHAELDFDVPGSEEEIQSPDLKVAIDTSVSIIQTNKKKPAELYKKWNPLWGEEPEDSDDYYYLIWEVESLIDEKSTQYYDFSLNDYDFKCTSPSGLNSSDLKVLGYNYSGNGNSYALEPAKVENQSIFGTRHDFVLTAVPKEWYENLEKDDEIILENSVDATVHPVDGKDDDTTASSQQTYALKLPKFAPPISGYGINKVGNRRTYQLDQFTDPDDTTDLTPYIYDITASGYSYEQTYSYNGEAGEDYDPKEDYRNYGKKKLNYELTDDEVSLEGYVGDISKGGYVLEKGDYYFTSVDFTYDINMVAKLDPQSDLPDNQSFDEENQVFNLTKPTPASGYTVYFDIYGEFNGSYQKIATVKAYTANSSAVSYESGMESFAAISNISDKGFTISFTGETKCTGYKIVTSKDYYYSTSFTAQPRIQLEKNNEGLQKWINEYYGTKDAENNEEKVTELRVTNTANLKIYVEDNKIFDADASGTDYQNESTKQSSITKSITAANNNPLYKRYEISWKIDISEYVLVSNGGASRVPVIQYGGEFFDLLPKGSSVDMSTVQVYREGNDPVEFTAKTLPGADNRVLLRVTIAEDQPGEKYSLCFTSYHSWEDIAAFGSNILNPAAYVTGNEDMANTGYEGTYKRGRYTGDSMDLMVDSINSAGGYDKIERTVDGDDISYHGETYDRTIFNYEPFDIKAIVMSNVGVSKAVKNAKEGSYTTETVIDESDGEYSYRLRFENGTATKSIDNVFVDFLEAFEGGGVKSVWKGTLKSIDVTNLEAKNVIPRVYYSTDTFRINESNVWYVDPSGDETRLVEGESSGVYEDGGKWMGIRAFLPKGDYENAYGNEHWILIDPELCVNGVYNLTGLAYLKDITAIAVDFTYADPEKFNDDQKENADSGNPEEDNKNAKITADNKYIMDLGEAAYVILNMDNSEVEPPLTRTDFDGSDEEYQAYINGFSTYNDIFFASNAFNKTQSSEIAQDNWLEQNYTTVAYRIRSDFYAKKVNADNTDETLGGITFNLSGVSYYGTTVNKNVTTTSNGILEFEDLEVGVYTLTEVDCGRDWQIDRTEYTVTVNSDKTVTVEPDISLGTDYSQSNNPFILTNKPRAHADIVFDKKLYENGKMVKLGVEGAVFKLSGLSDYGNDIVKIAVSDYSGKVLFEDVEQGTYELIEIEAPEGYVLSNIVYTVRVDEHGNWSITAADDSLMEGDSSTGYGIGNEKYQEFYLQKRSTEPVGKDRNVYLLEGAVFNLYGLTESGKVVDVNATTGFSSVYGEGIAHFGNLEPGTYYLREISAPTYVYIDKDGKEVEQKFYLDETIYTVVVNEKGVTITDPNGNVLEETKDSDGKTIEELYTFTNVPVGGQVIVRKVWIDDLTSEERAETVESPDIVISRGKPDPFENVYAEFDYYYDVVKKGNLGENIRNRTYSYFRRYTDKVTFSATETVTANDTEYPKLLIDGKDVGAVIVSTPESEAIYGWLDTETSTYYWYTNAVGAKMPTARDLFTGTGIADVDFSGIDFSEATSFAYMFNSCSNLVRVTNLIRPENSVSDVTAESMFQNCSNLAKDGTLDLSEFDTTGITNMKNMFKSAFTQGSGTKLNWGTALHTESVTSFAFMFNACLALTEISASEIIADSVTDADGFVYMFGDSKKLVSVPALKRSSNASSTVSMHHMFHNCNALPKIDLSEFHTGGVNDMQYLFNACNVLTALDLSSFDTSNVTNMQNMFAQCHALTKINVTSFDTSKVVNMICMFDTCKALPELDISSFTMESLTNANTMFCNCQTLVTIYANEHFDLSVLTAGNGNMFLNDYKLVGGNNTKYSVQNGTYAHIDGGISNPGYFTHRDAPAKVSLSFFSAIGAKILSFFDGINLKTVTSYAETKEPNDTSDGPDYRNSANHYNKTGASDICGEDHFFVVKTQEDVEALKESHPEIYELVKDLKDNEWIYVFDDVVGEDFYVWEENIPAGYEGDYDNFIDEDGNHRITNIVNGVATITNKHIDYKVGTLTISKTVRDFNTNEDVTDKVNTKYVFEITLSSASDVSPQTVNAVYYNTSDEENTKAEKSILFVGGKAAVEIQSGYALRFYDLPEETTYEVKELSDEEDIKSTQITVNDGNAVLTEKTVNGIIAGDTEISAKYENYVDADVRDSGEFMLKKLVENANGAVDPDTEYSFTIEFTNLLKNTEYSIYNGEEVVKTFTSGNDKTATVVVNLKADDILTFKDIPEGATYRITEAAGGAYISSYIVTTGDANSNTSSGNELSTQWKAMNPSEDTVTTTFTNRIVKVQSLSVSKTVLGAEPETPGEETKYKFVAQFSNLGARYQLIVAGIGTFWADEYGNLQIEFYLKSGEIADFNNIPVGANYSIYEDLDGELIPYYEVTYTDEATGETQKMSPAPSTSTGSDIAQAVQAAQANVDTAQTAYDTAASLLSYDKKALNSAIADAIALLTEEQITANAESIAVFTADNYIDDNETYVTARDAILALIADGSFYRESIAVAEAEVAKAVAEYNTARSNLAAAEAALKEARGSSYVEGSIELNQDTAIDFSNNKPFDLTVTKKVISIGEDLEKEFHFKVAFAYNGIPLSGSYSATLTGGARITDSSYRTDDYSYSFGDDGIVYFVLRNGAAITFENLPYGTAYTIVEIADEEYDVSVTVSGDEGAEIDGGTVSGSILGNISAKYVNIYKTEIADLPELGGFGIIPFYACGFALLALGAFLILYGKRQKRRN